jgi:hypothetical protein
MESIHASLISTSQKIQVIGLQTPKRELCMVLGRRLAGLALFIIYLVIFEICYYLSRQLFISNKI